MFNFLDKQTGSETFPLLFELVWAKTLTRKHSDERLSKEKQPFIFFPSLLFQGFLRDFFQFQECEIILRMPKTYTLVSRNFSQVFQRMTWE